DGPSAGVAITTSLLSALTGIPVLRDVGMTGEITLRGRVLPIGGLKEKLLAAKRAGLKTVILPLKNKKDLEEVPQNITRGLNLLFAENIDDVVKHALQSDPFLSEKRKSDIKDGQKITAVTA
ncbi:MAG: endopeptidase La, partial [Actinobacteria bacterium]|nr:endopeptidase La [Actinomycetota bacterium]